MEARRIILFRMNERVPVGGAGCGKPLTDVVQMSQVLIFLAWIEGHRTRPQNGVARRSDVRPESYISLNKAGFQYPDDLRDRTRRSKNDQDQHFCHGSRSTTFDPGASEIPFFDTILGVRYQEYTHRYYHSNDHPNHHTPNHPTSKCSSLHSKAYMLPCCP